jgi:uncharacterized membrane protein
MSRQPSLLYRSIEPLIQALWPIFLGWSGVMVALWWLGDSCVESVGNPGLRAAVAFIVRSADAAWLLLGALNLYLDLAAREGIARARTVALGIFGVALAIAWASVATAYPLGSVVYTSRLGARLGPVPLGWLLLWFVVVLGGKAFISRVWPKLSHTALSLAVGFVAFLTSFNLDPLAVQNYATWFAVSAALAWLIRDQNVAATRSTNRRPALVIVIVNLVFLTGHLRSLIGG